MDRLDAPHAAARPAALVLHVVEVEFDDGVEANQSVAFIAFTTPAEPGDELPKILLAGAHPDQVLQQGPRPRGDDELDDEAIVEALDGPRECYVAPRRQGLGTGGQRSFRRCGDFVPSIVGR